MPIAQISFSFGTDLQHPLQVADKPVLAGDRPGIARRLVLVVVHQHNAVGVGRDLLQIVVIGGGRHVDIKAQIARVQSAVELLDKGQVRRIASRRRGSRSRVKDRDRPGSAVKKRMSLLAQLRALVGILEHVAHCRIPDLRARVVVVQVGKDFSVFLGRLDDVLDLVQIVGIVHRVAVDHRILVHGVSLLIAISVPSGASTWSHCGKQHVDLVNVLLERGIAGGIVGNVIGRAQTFAGVEGNFGGLAVGLAPRRRAGRFRAAAAACGR